MQTGTTVSELNGRAVILNGIEVNCCDADELLRIIMQKAEGRVARLQAVMGAPFIAVGDWTPPMRDRAAHGWGTRGQLSFA